MFLHVLPQFFCGFPHASHMTMPEQPLNMKTAKSKQMEGNQQKPWKTKENQWTYIWNNKITEDDKNKKPWNAGPLQALQAWIWYEPTCIKQRASHQKQWISKNLSHCFFGHAHCFMHMELKLGMPAVDRHLTILPFVNAQWFSLVHECLMLTWHV